MDQRLIEVTDSRVGYIHNTPYAHCRVVAIDNTKTPNPPELLLLLLHYAADADPTTNWLALITA